MAIAAIYFVIAVFFFSLAKGLWQLNNWARVIVICLHSLVALGSLIRYIILFSASQKYGNSYLMGLAVVACELEVVLVVNGFVISGSYTIVEDLPKSRK